MSNKSKTEQNQNKPQSFSKPKNSSLKVDPKKTISYRQDGSDRKKSE